MQRPGDGDDAGVDVVALADLRSSSTSSRLRESSGSWNCFALRRKSSCGMFGDALLGHGAGEQAGVHGRIVDDADVVLLAEGKDLGFDGAVDHGVGRLQRGDGRDLQGAFHLGDVEVGDADAADLALALQLGHRGPAFFDFLVGHGPVDLVEVDDVDAAGGAGWLRLLRGCFLSVWTILRSASQIMAHLVKT